MAESLLSAASIPSDPPGLGGGQPPRMDVVYDSGRGVPATPYLAYLVSTDPGATGSLMPGLAFPIRSRLRPGVLDQDHQVFDPTWLVQAIFIAGAEPRSMRWLAFNRLRMHGMGAWGIVVDAEGPQAFRALQAVAPELRFAPARGEWLDEQLLAAGVSVYPVLVDTQGRAQQRLADSRFGPASSSFQGAHQGREGDRR